MLMYITTPSELVDIVTMNPDLSMEGLQLVMKHKTQLKNNREVDDFCGLSPVLMHSWLHDDCLKALNVSINAPEILPIDAPLLAYVEVIITDILESGGKLKATTKGNLPAKTVKKAASILSNLAVAKYETDPSISEFSGNNESMFNALHVTRILLQQTGFIKLQKGYFSLTKKGDTHYQKQGVNAFFVPLLQNYIEKFNWGYLDGFPDDVMISMCCLFCFWRLQQHGNVEQLCEEINVAFPWLQAELPEIEFFTQQEELQLIIESRLVHRFMTLFGFATVDPHRYKNGKKLPLNLELLPLFSQVIQFDI